MATKKEIKENSRDIIADIISRPMAIDGTYWACNIGLSVEELVQFKKNIKYLKTMQMRADLADEMITEALSNDLDITDIDALRRLGDKISAVGSLALASESIMTAAFVSIKLIVMYGVTVGIWGLALRSNFFTFVVYGTIFGVFVCLLFVAPVLVGQRTRERLKDMSFGAGSSLGGIAIILGVIGLIVFAVRQVFNI